MTIKLGFGEGSSPALHGDRLVVQWDHEGESFIVALDKKTGQGAVAAAAGGEDVLGHAAGGGARGRAQVVTSATSRVRSYDLATASCCGRPPA